MSTSSSQMSVQVGPRFLLVLIFSLIASELTYAAPPEDRFYYSRSVEVGSDIEFLDSTDFRRWTIDLVDLASTSQIIGSAREFLIKLGLAPIQAKERKIVEVKLRRYSPISDSWFWLVVFEQPPEKSNFRESHLGVAVFLDGSIPPTRITAYGGGDKDE